MNKKWCKEVLKLTGSILLTLLAGLIGSMFTATSVSSWFATLQKPFFAPPASIFAPVWTILYILMGTAYYLVFRQGTEDEQVRRSLAIYMLQLILNALWPAVFFGLRSILGGLIVLWLLWIGVFFTIRAFYFISKPAAYLLIPYLLWVSFALLLNLALWRLN